MHSRVVASRMALRLVCEALIVVGRRVLVWLSDRDPDPPNHPLILDFPTGWNEGNDLETSINYWFFLAHILGLAIDYLSQDFATASKALNVRSSKYLLSSCGLSWEVNHTLPLTYKRLYSSPYSPFLDYHHRF